MSAVIIVNMHEPDHEVAARLLELAEEKGHDVRAVEAQRGEHDAGLSFRVPEDVAEAFNAERANLWPDKISEGDEANRPVAALNEDAVAADGVRSATDAAATAAREDADETAAQARKRTGKAPEKPKE
jgi:hypothetical protein